MRRMVRHLEMDWALLGVEAWFFDRDHYDVLRQRVFEMKEWIRGASDQYEGLPDVDVLWRLVVSFEEELDV